MKRLRTIRTTGIAIIKPSDACLVVISKYKDHCIDRRLDNIVDCLETLTIHQAYIKCWRSKTCI